MTHPPWHEFTAALKHILKMHFLPKLLSRRQPFGVFAPLLCRGSPGPEPAGGLSQARQLPGTQGCPQPTATHGLERYLAGQVRAGSGNSETGLCNFQMLSRYCRAVSSTATRAHGLGGLFPTAVDGCSSDSLPPALCRPEHKRSAQVCSPFLFPKSILHTYPHAQPGAPSELQLSLPVSVFQMSRGRRAGRPNQGTLGMDFQGQGPEKAALTLQPREMFLPVINGLDIHSPCHFS